MAFDGILMSSLQQEFNERLLGGRIDKVYQPESDELILQIKNHGTKHNLFITADSSMPYLSIIDEKKENPMQAPMFCMLMRKHISSGKIIKIEQVELERIIEFSIESRNELGDMITYKLIVEIMGKHSNIILITDSDQVIIDSIKRIPFGLSRVRQVLPGLKYERIPTDKMDLREETLSGLKSAVEASLQQTKPLPLYKFLYMHYQGMSPILSKSIVFKTGLDHDVTMAELNADIIERLYHQIDRLKEIVINNGFTPNTIKEKSTGKYVDFSSVDLGIFNADAYDISHNNIIDTINDYYQKKNVVNRFLQKSVNLRKTISTKLDKAQNKIKNLQMDLSQAENADEYKINGELILANLYQINKGDNETTVLNYYSDEHEMMTIKLDIRLSPSDNAQKYFKKYNKLKTAQIEVAKQIEETKHEIEYLENVLNNLENVTDNATLEEIRTELANEGIIKKRYTKKGTRVAKSKPFEYLSSDGFTIFAGKNNIQNDQLTLKTASKSDIWMHTKIIPGSHVIIKAEGREVPEQTLLEAAIIAAYHSKAKDSSQVPVDYTEVRNVSKPSGSKPGMVIYVKNKTLYVTPDQELIDQLIVKK